MEDNNKTININPAIISLGLKTVRSELIQICTIYPKLPLVSIGSGDGLIERSVKHLVKNEFILVDPEPSSYHTANDSDFKRHVEVLGLPPDYAYTKDLVSKRPEIAKGHACLLFLNWCTPGEDNDYDLEAITLLKPTAILVIMDMKERAGSKQFHAFLREKTTTYKPITITSVSDPCKQEYACAHTPTSMQFLVDIDGPLLPIIETVTCGHDHSARSKRNIEILELDAEEENERKRVDILNNIYALASDRNALREMLNDPSKRNYFFETLASLKEEEKEADLPVTTFVSFTDDEKWFSKRKFVDPFPPVFVPPFYMRDKEESLVINPLKKSNITLQQFYPPVGNFNWARIEDHTLDHFGLLHTEGNASLEPHKELVHLTNDQREANKRGIEIIEAKKEGQYSSSIDTR